MKADGLLLPAELSRELVRVARAALPQEACGLLLGVDGRVRAIHPARNRAGAEGGRRFELHPVDLMRAEERARERGWSLLAVYHSHPEAPAVPSRSDLEGALPGCLQLILSLRGGRPTDLRLWRYAGGRAVRVELAECSGV